jgi:polar amino acid transport system substrate-binding protein
VSDLWKTGNLPTSYRISVDAAHNIRDFPPDLSGGIKMTRFFSLAALFLAMGLAPSVASACGGSYKVKSGDSLSVIANEHYDDARKWTAIHQSNLSVIGENPDRLLVGMTLTLSCINGLPQGLGSAPQQAAQPADPTPEPSPSAPRALEAQINLVTAGDFAPFTDQSLENGGLLADVVNTAMQAATGSEGYKVHWVNDWSSHLDPLMSKAMMDMAFPWYQPDCDGDPSQYRCANFHFSDAMFEMLIVLFVDKARPMPFASDADIEGRTLCRPAGYFTHDLDRADRRWLTDGKIELKQPVRVSDCFDMLRNGEVDAVALNEFTGREAVKSLGLEEDVYVVPGRPLSIEGLHVLVHKAHPEADALLETINGGLAAIKSDGRYQQIVDAHMSTIWAGF